MSNCRSEAGRLFQILGPAFVTVPKDILQNRFVFQFFLRLIPFYYS